MFIIIVRTLIMYLFVILSIRIMGKRQIGDMQPGELVVTIMISEIAAVPIQDINQPILSGIVALMTLVFLEIFISFFAMKFYKFRRVLYGDSAIIIKDGIIDQSMLKRLRITGPDLLEVLRNQNVFDINEVAYAILETNGQLSVMMKPEYQNTVFNNLKGKYPNGELPSLIISDGKIIKNAIKQIDISEKEVLKIIHNKNIPIKNIFIMTCDRNKGINIIEKEQK